MTNKSVQVLFLLSCILTVNSTPSPAQSKLQAGPITSSGITYLHGHQQNGIMLHGHAGLIASYRIGNAMNLQEAVVISNKGYESRLYHPEQRLTLGYTDFITTFKYHMADAFFIGVGVYAGWLFYNNYRYLYYSNDYYDEPDISGLLNHFDVGIHGCMGLEFKNGIGMEVSLLDGLRDVFKSKGTDSLDGEGYQPVILPEAKGKNTVITTSFYYLISFRKREKMLGFK